MCCHSNREHLLAVLGIICLIPAGGRGAPWADQSAMADCFVIFVFFSRGLADIIASGDRCTVAPPPPPLCGPTSSPLCSHPLGWHSLSMTACGRGRRVVGVKQIVKRRIGQRGGPVRGRKPSHARTHGILRPFFFPQPPPPHQDSAARGTCVRKEEPPGGSPGAKRRAGPGCAIPVQSPSSPERLGCGRREFAARFRQGGGGGGGGRCRYRCSKSAWC